MKNLDNSGIFTQDDFEGFEESDLFQKLYDEWIIMNNIALGSYVNDEELREKGYDNKKIAEIREGAEEIAYADKKEAYDWALLANQVVGAENI